MKKEKAPSLRELSNVPEDPVNAGPERPLCQRCGLFRTTSNPFLRPPSPTSWTHSLLLVGEAPGGEEEKTGAFFQGKAGKIIRTEIKEAGFSEADIHFLNAVRCRPPNNRTPTTDEIRCCRPFLLWELQHLQPKAVLGLGTVAAKTIQNDGSARITPARGRLLKVEGL